MELGDRRHGQEVLHGVDGCLLYDHADSAAGADARSKRFVARFAHLGSDPSPWYR